MKFACVIVIISVLAACSLYALEDCPLPQNCRIAKVYSLLDVRGNTKVFTKTNYNGMRCDINKDFRFDFNLSQYKYDNDTIKCKLDMNPPFIEIQMPNSDQSILGKSVNIKNVFNLFSHVFGGYFFNMVNLKGFELNLIDYNEEFFLFNSVNMIFCVNSRLDFYQNGKQMQTCKMIDDLGMSEPKSIFQIYSLYAGNKYPINSLTLMNSEFKNMLCPLIFAKTKLANFHIFGMIDSFYKKSVLTISNERYYTLGSEIQALVILKAQNINIDTILLNPSVFEKLNSIYIHGSVNRISQDAFRYLYSLTSIAFQPLHFKKLMHKNGNKWIKAINDNITVNMNNYEAVYYWSDYIKHIEIDCFDYSLADRMSDVLPDEDFCLYYDFPFQQLLYLIQICWGDELHFIHIDFSCTYFWLTQYYYTYLIIYFEKNMSDYHVISFNMNRILNSAELINKTFQRCNFTLMADRCSKSDFTAKTIIGRHDYLAINKILELAIKLSSHIVSLFGIVTNLIVVIIILHKKNNEIFKGFKQYTYLCANSIFCLLILLIQILAWTSECFYPFEVFCPEIRKLVFIQLFKMVFKECFVTAFRFMCNFTYVAFALNRIGLIGKDHNKLVKFMSDLGVKKYLGVTFVISIGLSVVKYFKYEINYDQPELSYPIPNELDLSAIFRTQISNDGFIIANMISDIFNYILFVFVIFSVDIYMLVRLKRTLAEKLKKSESLNKSASFLDNMRKENEEAINKVIKMIVLNTTLSLLFKLPVSFIPIFNVQAEFYYKDYKNQLTSPKFGEFYSFLLDTGFYDNIIEISDFFYTLAISIQMLIYKHFDKKFRNGFDQFFHSKNPKEAKKGEKNVNVKQ